MFFNSFKLGIDSRTSIISYIIFNAIDTVCVKHLLKIVLSWKFLLVDFIKLNILIILRKCVLIFLVSSRKKHWLSYITVVSSISGLSHAKKSNTLIQWKRQVTSHRQINWYEIFCHIYTADWEQHIPRDWIKYSVLEVNSIERFN